MPELTFVNGRPAASLPLSDRGLAYGDGLFETINVAAGKAKFLSLHLKRLHKGCSRLAINPDRARLEQEIQRLLDGVAGKTGVLKIVVTRGGSQRGYRGDPTASANRYLQFLEIDDNHYRRMQAGVTLRLCRHRLPINPALAGIKHLNRLDNVLARSEWREAWIDEGIMLDTQGRVVEGTLSNLFLVMGGVLVTPSLHRCGVEGIMREVILHSLAHRVGVRTEVGDIALQELYRADELFICNALMGICPVLAVDCLRKQTGPITPALQQALAAMG